MSKAKLIESGGKYAGKKLTDILKRIKANKRAKVSKEKFKKTFGYDRTESVTVAGKKYHHRSSSGSGDKAAIVPVKAQTRKGSSFKVHKVRGKGSNSLRGMGSGRDIGSSGSAESWRMDMERLTNMPSFNELRNSIFRKKRKKRGGLSKFDKGGYSEADYPSMYKSGKKGKKPSLAEQEKDTQDYDYGGFDKNLDVVEIPTFKRGGDNMPARNKRNFRPTEKGAGMTKAGVAAYRRANPGSKLQTAVTGKVKAGSKAAKRRKSYCARSLGQLKRASAKTRNDPNSRIRQARRRWKC